MVASAPATLAGGSAGSAVPLRKTIGAEELTGPLAPAARGQYLQAAFDRAASDRLIGVNAEPAPIAAIVLGFRTAHSSLQMIVTNMIGVAVLLPAVSVKSFRNAVQSPPAAAWMSFGNEAASLMSLR